MSQTEPGKVSQKQLKELKKGRKILRGIHSLIKEIPKKKLINVWVCGGSINSRITYDEFMGFITWVKKTEWLKTVKKRRVVG